MTADSTAVPYEENSLEHLIHLLASANDSDDLELARYWHEDDPTTIPLAIELMSTGIPSARSEVTRIMSEGLTKMQRSLDAAQEYREYTHQWRNMCGEVWSPRVKRQIKAVWAVEHVCAESSLLDGVSEFSDKIIRQQVWLETTGIDGILSIAHLAPEDSYHDDEYWRGVVIAAFADTQKTLKGQPETLIKFVRWAGGSKTPVDTITELCRTRAIFDVEQLEELLSQQHHTASPLTDGIL